MTRLWTVLSLLALGVMACTQQGEPKATQEAAAPTAPAEAPKAPEAAPAPLDQNKPAAPSAPPVTPPPPLSDSERALQAMAALPEDPMGARDLSAACDAAQAERKKEIEEKELPKIRLQEMDRDTVTEWQKKTFKALLNADREATKDVRAQMHASMRECMRRLEQSQSEPPRECQALVTGDLAKCDSTDLGYGHCKAMGGLKANFARFATWDKQKPPVDECDRPPLSTVFFSKEMCQLAAEKGCDAMFQAIQANLCTTVWLKKPVALCEGEGLGSPWCKLLKAVQLPKQAECEEVLRAGEFGLPRYVCNGNERIADEQGPPESCGPRELAEFEVPPATALACGGLSFALTGVKSHCDAPKKQSDYFACYGALLFDFAVNKVDPGCTKMGGVSGKVCEAMVQSNPELCPLEPKSTYDKEEVFACLTPYVVVKDDGTDTTRGTVVLEALGPWGWRGECTFVVNVPGDDGETWNVPVQGKVSAQVFTQIRLPATVTKAAGAKVTSKCKWEEVREEKAAPIGSPEDGSAPPTSPAPPAPRELPPPSHQL